MASLLMPHRTHHHHHVEVVRTTLQKLCIGMGLAFVSLGVIGIVMPGFMEMHLSMAHNLIHIASGLLALWCGYSSINLRAYNFCIAFGTVYGLLGVAGLVLGEPGYPGVGYTHADANLLRVIPDVLEFATMDHIVHIVMASALIIPAYYWKKDQALRSIGRVSVNAQGRTGVFKQEKGPTIMSDSTSTTEVSGAEIDRVRKMNRPSDYEKRL